MKREERLEHLAKNIYSMKGTIKEVESNLKEQREKFFELLEDNLASQEHLLPVQTIEIPQEFFERTGMSEQDFVASRFPGWQVEHVEKNISTGMHTFILKKDKRYIPSVVETTYGDGKIRVSKEIMEYEPEIDWDTLAAEDPELYEQICYEEEVVVQQLDEQTFEQLIEESPEVLEKIRRHLKVRTPALKATARTIKDGKE
jgi:hypothetical protein